jgi:hypothetical protein
LDCPAAKRAAKWTTAGFDCPAVIDARRTPQFFQGHHKCKGAAPSRARKTGIVCQSITISETASMGLSLAEYLSICNRLEFPFSQTNSDARFTARNTSVRISPDVSFGSYARCGTRPRGWWISALS